MADVLLNEQTQIVLDGSGNGTARLGPSAHGEYWSPDSASVKVATNNDEATCTIYVGHIASDLNFCDQTFSGSTGDSTGRVSGSTLWLGNYIYAVWAGGDAGATATLVVTGSAKVQ